MGRKKHTFEEVADSDFDLREIRDMELLVLKSHIYVETILRRIVSDKLAIPEDNPTLGSMLFWQLAQLALGGAGDEELLRHAEQLNTVRNEIAHELYLACGSKALEAFVTMAITARRPDYTWPSAHEDDARRPDFVQAAISLIRPLIDKMTPREATWPRSPRLPLTKP